MVLVVLVLLVMVVVVVCRVCGLLATHLDASIPSPNNLLVAWGQTVKDERSEQPHGAGPACAVTQAHEADVEPDSVPTCRDEGAAQLLDDRAAGAGGDADGGFAEPLDMVVGILNLYQ